MKLFYAIFLLIVSNTVLAQFAGPVGSANTTAMHADSNAFVSWASGCRVIRGYQDVSNTSLGFADLGDSTMALGKAGTNAVVSLGDGGIAILTFQYPINNGSGYDFAVFENGFNDTFLELAFVEVSSDGINFFRFPATSNSQTSIQFTNGAVMDATLINNLAGKYRELYGTPFDLQELSGLSSLLNINAITHIKIIDVVGSLNASYARYDKNNNIINDPWPTPFSSSGFDLDAVGVIHQSIGFQEIAEKNCFSVYPNPCTDNIVFKLGSNDKLEMEITNNLGQTVIGKRMVSDDTELSIAHLTGGIYFVHLKGRNYYSVEKLIKE